MTDGDNPNRYLEGSIFMDCQGSELKDLETLAVNHTAWLHKVAVHWTHWVHYEHDDDDGSYFLFYLGAGMQTMLAETYI